MCLLPFNHPIRLAEDLAVLDNISNGRVEIGVGMGYAPHEFRGFGLPVSRRLSLTDEGLAVLRRAFAGETFSFEGKRYTFQNVKITPSYVQNGGPPLWVAAMAEPGNPHRDEELAALKRLDDQARRIEGHVSGPSVPELIEEERLASHAHGGRSAFGWEPAPANRNGTVAKLRTGPGGIFSA